MRCPEVQQTLRQFIDGRVDADTRKQVGLHLVGCEICSRLINDGQFWDDAVVALLEHEVPPDLRDQILSDAGLDETAHPRARRVDLKRMDGRARFAFLRWAVTRNNSPQAWLEVAALVVGALLAVYFLSSR